MKLPVHPRIAYPGLWGSRAIHSVPHRRGIGATAATVSVANLSGGSPSRFQVGDTVQVIVAGPPNQPVTFTGTQNGVPFAAQSLGSTDANGKFTWSGVVTAPLIGTISETWSVGGQPAGTVSFTVAANPNAPVPPPAPPLGPAQGSVLPNQTIPPGNWFTDPSQSMIGGAGMGLAIPNWMLLGGAALGLFIVMRRKK